MNAPSHVGPRRRSPFARLLYWSPVFVCMGLFAQVSFLGLRPAMSERRRLAEAQTMLEGRHARDLALRDQATLGLRVRADPIFLERQRRLRLVGKLPSAPGVSGTAAPTAPGHGAPGTSSSGTGE